MLDLDRLRRIRMRKTPGSQRVFAPILGLDYRFPRRTYIAVEGLDNIPQDRPVFLAMNHTDRFNYWPLQYFMHREGLRYTATWVKGKYYQNPLMAWLMDRAGNIPLPSRGYVVANGFQQATGRPPSGDEYRALRNLVDGKPGDAPLPAVAAWLDASGGPDVWADERRRLFTDMMSEVMRINRDALDVGLHILVFPEGTRRLRLGPGHTGLVQAAWHLGATIVPVGCNGSHRVYPGNSPSARGGNIVYRVGPPLKPDGPELGHLTVTTPYTPFTLAATAAHGQAFRAGTDVVMDHIATLLDEEHQRAKGDDGAGAGGGAKRFV